MQSIKVYRNINTKDKFLGLELVDGCFLLFVFFLAFMIRREGLFGNCLLLVCVYLGLRALKRGKPDGYLLVLARYLLMSPIKRSSRFEEAESLR